MTAGHRFAADIGGAFPPGVQNIVEAFHIAARPPQSEQRTVYLVSAVGIVMFQVDGRARAVILAGGMNHRRVLETSQIFVEGILVESRGGEAIEARLEPKLGAIANHRFRKRRLLNQKEPVETESGPFLGDVVKKLV